MKKLFTLFAAGALFALAFSFAAKAQRVNPQIGVFYQKGQYSFDEAQVKDTFLGASFLVQFNIFYPESIYLTTGLEASLGLSKENNVPDYRIELPVRLSWMWEPTPRFAIGPFAGIYGAANLMVTPDDKTLYNTLQGGYTAGASIQFGSFDLSGGYWRDFVPFHKGGSPFSGFRVSLNMFI